MVATSRCRGRSPDEQATISINYTSGTTGDPKGVVIHSPRCIPELARRGASTRGHSSASVYLWTLPMFHCNGWCTTWGVTAVGGTHVCLRAGPARRDLATDRCGRCDAPQRRAGRDDVDRARAPGASIRARDDGHDGGRRAQPDLRRRDGSAGSAGDPRVRAHRGLRAVLGVRLAAGLACARAAGASAKSSARQGVGMVTAERVRVVGRRHERRPGGRRDDGRDRDARQRRDEGLLPR